MPIIESLSEWKGAATARLDSHEIRLGEVEDEVERLHDEAVAHRARIGLFAALGAALGAGVASGVGMAIYVIATHVH